MCGGQKNRILIVLKISLNQSNISVKRLFVNLIYQLEERLIMRLKVRRFRLFEKKILILYNVYVLRNRIPLVSLLFSISIKTLRNKINWVRSCVLGYLTSQLCPFTASLLMKKQTRLSQKSLLAVFASVAFLRPLWRRWLIFGQPPTNRQRFFERNPTIEGFVDNGKMLDDIVDCG